WSEKVARVPVDLVSTEVVRSLPGQSSSTLWSDSSEVTSEAVLRDMICQVKIHGPATHKRECFVSRASGMFDPDLSKPRANEFEETYVTPCIHAFSRTRLFYPAELSTRMFIDVWRAYVAVIETSTGWFIIGPLPLLHHLAVMPVAKSFWLGVIFSRDFGPPVHELPMRYQKSGIDEETRFVRYSLIRVRRLRS
ncbi:7946_t:CDS:2, partial [Acaulospora colombiana]